MIRYIIRCPKPSNHFVDIEMIVDNIKNEALLEIQLPVWRPGRYQLGNFAKNIRSWKATDSKGNILESSKKSSHIWQVFTANNKSIHIHYNFYAYNMDAGSSWLDEELLYVNGINCFLYINSRINQACELVLDLKKNIPVACGMKELSNYHYILSDYHELVDSPFIVSEKLICKSYTEKGVKFNIWFYGLEKADWNKILADFKSFTKTQIEMMGDFPANEFHFLNIIPPYELYHGVEHKTSTVIAMGPACKLMQGELYDKFLGISCHELFHCWNVKSIRPAEMMPYDYSKENYSAMGYLAEGVTTYYGDYLLLKSGVWDFEKYASKLNLIIKRHFHNYGRFNLSVAESSFDTWLDGYEQGIPHRKTSIYIKGCLAAFILDINIRKLTKNLASLDDVMKILYHDFAKKNKGVSQEYYKNIIEKVSSASFNWYFNEIINGILPLESYIENALNYIGCSLSINFDGSFLENHLGIKVVIENEAIKVLDTALNSPAENAGISRGDELIAVNNELIKPSFHKELFEYHKDKNVKISFFSSGKLKESNLEIKLNERFYGIYEIKKNNNISTQQQRNYVSWANLM